MSKLCLLLILLQVADASLRDFVQDFLAVEAGQHWRAAVEGRVSCSFAHPDDSARKVRTLQLGHEC
jgi:hypothetical protein